MSLAIFFLSGIIARIAFALYSLFWRKLPLPLLIVCDTSISIACTLLYTLPFFLIEKGAFSIYPLLFFIAGFFLPLIFGKIKWRKSIDKK